MYSRNFFFCPTKCTGKEAKNPVFDNKLHNEVATYSKSVFLKVGRRVPRGELKGCWGAAMQQGGAVGR